MFVGIGSHLSAVGNLAVSFFIAPILWSSEYVHMKKLTFRFRDFDIYELARNFRVAVRKKTRLFPRSEQYKLIDQIERSALSVVLNIAEGSAKKSDKEFHRYLGIAIASLNEVIAGFDCAYDDGLISGNDIESLEQEAELLAKKIGAMMKVL